MEEEEEKNKAEEFLPQRPRRVLLFLPLLNFLLHLNGTVKKEGDYRPSPLGIA